MNKSKIINFIKSIGIFFVGSSLSKMIGFFLLPIYTSYILTEDYGYYDLSITYLTVIVELVYFDIWVSALRFMYDEKEEKGKPIKAASIIFCISTIIYFAIMLLLMNVADIKYIHLIIIVGFLQAVTSFYTFISRGFHKNVDFSISGIICTTIAATLNILLIVYCKMDFSALYYSLIIGYLCQIIYLEIRVGVARKVLYAPLDCQIVKKIFVYTLPLGLNAVAFWILNSFNRVAISRVMSLSDNGIYAVGQKFANMLAFAITCFTYAWQDFAFSESRSENKSKFYTIACTAYFTFLSIAIAILMPVIKIIFPVLVNVQYNAAQNMIPISLIAAAMSGFSTFVGNIFYAIKNTKIIFISTVCSCIVNLILVLPFIKLWGLNGANLAIFVSFTINVILRYIVLKREIGLKCIWRYILVSVSIVLTSSYIYNELGIVCNLIWILVMLVIAGIMVIKLVRKRK